MPLQYHETGMPKPPMFEGGSSEKKPALAGSFRKPETPPKIIMRTNQELGEEVNYAIDNYELNSYDLEKEIIKVEDRRQELLTLMAKIEAKQNNLGKKLKSENIGRAAIPVIKEQLSGLDAEKKFLNEEFKECEERLKSMKKQQRDIAAKAWENKQK